MKFRFKAQAFQQDAVDAVLRVFEGQAGQEGDEGQGHQGHQGGQTQAHPGPGPGPAPGRLLGEDDYVYASGRANAELSLDRARMLDNVRAVQGANGLPPSKELADGLGAISLDVEMETGTGKTYVYIKTMFELHRRYGWGKFIVVVPSLAIREGARKSFEMTQGHFMELYGLKARFFVYGSSNLHRLDEYAGGRGIDAMIINTQAFASSLKEDGRSRESRIIYSERDEFGSRRPIDVIRAARPIVILDEPQKMGGAATQDALRKNFRPLFSLNYSATHRTSHNLVYKLGALEAFEQGIVKKIEVVGFDAKNILGTDGYLYLSEIALDARTPPRARLEIDKKLKGGVKRETRLLGHGSSIFEASGGLEGYRGLHITDIDPWAKKVTFSSGAELSVGDAAGCPDEAWLRRLQIRETIRAHLKKEESLFAMGIKCLSLFFIDDVAKYRQYAEDGTKMLGEYGRAFEEEYAAALKEALEAAAEGGPEGGQEAARAAARAAYLAHLRGIDADKTHDGYFSVDRQGRAVNSEVGRGAECSDDASAYNRILRDKEGLLSLDRPLRFIFSHSALREGWDSPNVFQICTLKRSDSATARRQEVGRGLRLCVNQEGDRQDAEALGHLVHEVNRLTVVASEGYAAFVRGLQAETRDDMRGGPAAPGAIIGTGHFTGMTVPSPDGGAKYTLLEGHSRAIYNYLVKENYLDDSGAATAEYRRALEEGRLAPLPDRLAPYADGIHGLIRGALYPDGGPDGDPGGIGGMVEDARATKVPNGLNANFDRPEFQALWAAIRGKYTYTVDLDSQELIDRAVEALDEGLMVAAPSFVKTAGVQEGAEFMVCDTKVEYAAGPRDVRVKYDLIGDIARGAGLTRRTAAAILVGLGPKLAMFAVNPEAFISKATRIIDGQKAELMVKRIKYGPSGEEPHGRSIFEAGTARLDRERALRARRAVQDYLFLDSDAERKFARAADAAEEVAAYAKLPKGGYLIPTPLGYHSPDWAVAFAPDRAAAFARAFCVAETKGADPATDPLGLRAEERLKIECAKRLFEDLPGGGVAYHPVAGYQALLDAVMGWPGA